MKVLSYLMLIFLNLTSYMFASNYDEIYPILETEDIDDIKDMDIVVDSLTHSFMHFEATLRHIKHNHDAREKSSSDLPMIAEHEIVAGSSYLFPIEIADDNDGEIDQRTQTGLKRGRYFLLPLDYEEPEFPQPPKKQARVDAAHKIPHLMHPPLSAQSFHTLTLKNFVKKPRKVDAALMRLKHRQKQGEYRARLKLLKLRQDLGVIDEHGRIAMQDPYQHQ